MFNTHHSLFHELGYQSFEMEEILYFHGYIIFEFALVCSHAYRKE